MKVKTIMKYYLVNWEDSDLCETCGTTTGRMFVVGARSERELFLHIDGYDDARDAHITKLPSGPFAINAVRAVPPLEKRKKAFGDMLIARIPKDERNDLG
jgi:hypothetical protein